MEKATSPRSGEHRRPHSRSGQVTRQTQASAYVNNHPEGIAHRGLNDAIQHSPFLATQRQRLLGMFGGAAQLKAGPQRVTGLVVQRQWKKNVNGPPGFDPDVAVANADWSNPRHVSVNLGAVQPTDPDWTSYRITAWAPSIVNGWEVTVAAHVYFEANAKTRKNRRTQFGHLYVNDWEGFSTEADAIRQTVYAGVRPALFAKMPDIINITHGGSVDVVGAYDRPSYRPRKL
jgi:hypothetical protein